MNNIKELIRDIKDFPIEGIVFRDITTLLKDAEGLKIVMEIFINRYKDSGIKYVAGAESRGFIFGAGLAYNLGVGFVPIRKKGKLPAKTVTQEYELEYGTDIIEIHEDAIGKGDKVLFIDDLLATGGTAEASVKLLEKVGAEIVELAFLIELVDLKGKDKLKGENVFSILEY
jgi:adenine phosphoribosyltransferase